MDVIMGKYEMNFFPLLPIFFWWRADNPQRQVQAYESDNYSEQSIEQDWQPD